MASTRTHDNECSKGKPSTGDKRPADEQEPKQEEGDSAKDSPSKAKKQKTIDKYVKVADETRNEEKEQDLQGQDHSEKEEEKSGGKKTSAAKEERENKPSSPEVEGNAEPGELAPGMAEVSKDEVDRKHGITERGQIAFLYRPKVETNDPHSIDDVSKFHILLMPHGEKLHRLIAVGKKQLPEYGGGSRGIWGQVMEVGEDLKALKDSLGASTYETKTRGTRHQPGARVAATGAYVLHTPEEGHYPADSANASAVYHTTLAYELAMPHEIGEVQEALNIHETGALTLQVKNPETESTNPAVRNQPASKHPQYPPELSSLFTTRWIPATPPTLLSYPGAELLLLPSKHSPEEDLGDSAKEKLDEEEKDVEKKIEGTEGKGEVEKALKELGMKGLIEGKALEGHWE
ncbi:hypothetical protein JCM11251_000478 [Rhodosporidiobolus azoricus]